MTRRKRRSVNTRFLRLYNEEARHWGQNYMKKHFWRIRAMYDFDDIKQDVLFVFLKTCKRYPKSSNEDILRIFKARMVGRVHNRARECFPNTYALQEGIGQVVIPLEDYTHEYATPNEFLACLEHFSDLLPKLPKELADVLRLLIEDFTGVSCIEQRRTKRLSGADRLEPFTIALARIVRLNPHRDLIEELAKELNTNLGVTNNVS